jgi:hypothetical protein
MKKFYTALLFLAIIFLNNTQAKAGQKLRVYFMGNSYTAVNNLPQMVADVAASMGDTLIFDSHTPGGWTIENHWDTATDPCVAKIITGNWDYVVLQEQSQAPAYGILGPTHPTYVYSELFTRLIRDSVQCTVSMFYMTWGYKNGDQANCQLAPYNCTYQGMDSALRMRYLELADSFDAVVTPVGAVRRYIRNNYPGIELYQADGSHPTVAGTYAAACGFYVALFKKDPALTSFTSGLPATDAANIRTAAKTVVYDSLSKWGLGIYDLYAAYDHSISNTTVTFTNKSSLKAQSYSWDFGDGNNSVLKNPVHTYASKGEYTVTLTVNDVNGCSKIISQKLNLFPAGIYNTEHVSFTITPNPATDYITILPHQQTARFSIRIINAMGQTVYLAPAGSNADNKIDLSAFSKGMYYITLYNEAGLVYYEKFIKE